MAAAERLKACTKASSRWKAALRISGRGRYEGRIAAATLRTTLRLTERAAVPEVATVPVARRRIAAPKTRTCTRSAARCGVPYTRHCDVDVHFLMNRACAGRRRCSVAVSAATFGDPCGYDEFLRIQYRCVAGTDRRRRRFLPRDAMHARYIRYDTIRDTILTGSTSAERRQWSAVYGARVN